MSKIDERCPGSHRIMHYGSGPIVCECGRTVPVVNGRVAEHLK